MECVVISTYHHEGTKNTYISSFSGSSEHALLWHRE